MIWLDLKIDLEKFFHLNPEHFIQYSLIHKTLNGWVSLILLSTTVNLNYSQKRSYFYTKIGSTRNFPLCYFFIVSPPFWITQKILSFLINNDQIQIISFLIKFLERAPTFIHSFFLLYIKGEQTCFTKNH